MMRKMEASKKERKKRKKKEEVVVVVMAFRLKNGGLEKGEAGAAISFCGFLITNLF